MKMTRQIRSLSTVLQVGVGLMVGLAWVTQSRADLLVNFNKDLTNSYVTEVAWYVRGAPVTGTAGDYDGQADADDYRCSVVFSDTLPLGPDALGADAYTGPDYYGGSQGTIYDSLGSDPSRNYFGGNVTEKDSTGDYVRFYYQNQSPSCTQDVHGCWYFKLPGNANWTFDETSSLKSSRHDAWSAGFTGRWLVREGTAFWVSQASFTDLLHRAPVLPLGPPNTAPSTTLTFASKSNHGKWAPYNPASNLIFNASQTFVDKVFKDVTAVGIVYGTDAPMLWTAPFGIQFNTFQVDAVETPPAGTVLGVR